MRPSLRLAAIVSTAALLGSLAACGSPPMNTSGTAYPSYPPSNYPASNYPNPNYPNTNPNTNYPNANYPSNAPSAYVVYGRVTGIDVIRTGQQGQGIGAGAIVGGVVGGVLGNQIGSGTGRGLATAAGVVGGAVVGNSIENSHTAATQEIYRMSVQTDNGTMRSYDMTTLGDLRIGDHVRIENGQVVRL